MWVKTEVKFSLPEERQQQRNDYEVSIFLFVYKVR